MEQLRHYVRGFLGRNWFIAYRKRRWRQLSERDDYGFTRVHQPRDRFFADPFVIQVLERSYVFFEDYDVAHGRGVISYVEVERDNTTTPPSVALSKPYHLSYPFVFEHEREIYLLPETASNRTIELYRAREFPHIWEHYRVLVPDTRAVDSTLHFDGIRWWLFTCVTRTRQEAAKDLSLFVAGSLDAEFRPHPRNPVVRHSQSVRPAGKLFRDAGRLIRPSQDSTHTYGGQISLNHIALLDEREYSEASVGTVSPDWMSLGLATHTLNFTDSLEVIDGRRRRRLLWPRGTEGRGLA